MLASSSSSERIFLVKTFHVLTDVIEGHVECLEHIVKLNLMVIRYGLPVNHNVCDVTVLTTGRLVLLIILDDALLVEVVEDLGSKLADHGHQLILEVGSHLLKLEHVLRVKQAHEPRLQQLLVVDQVITGEDAYVAVERETHEEETVPANSGAQRQLGTTDTDER